MGKLMMFHCITFIINLIICESSSVHNWGDYHKFVIFAPHLYRKFILNTFNVSAINNQCKDKTYDEKKKIPYVSRRSYDLTLYVVYSIEIYSSRNLHNLAKGRISSRLLSRGNSNKMLSCLLLASPKIILGTLSWFLVTVLSLIIKPHHIGSITCL